LDEWELATSQSTIEFRHLHHDILRVREALTSELSLNIEDNILVRFICTHPRLAQIIQDVLILILKNGGRNDKLYSYKGDKKVKVLKHIVKGSSMQRGCGRESSWLLNIVS
jgi:hypothetical protein